MSVPYTDSEASEARQWSNRYGPPNAWTASLGTAARMIGRLLDERERLMAKQTVAEYRAWVAENAAIVKASKEGLRDHFAAAALTGLLARGLLQSNLLAADAYKVADAMLRERAKKSHDAAPAATAGTPGTGDTQEPHTTPSVGSVRREGTEPVAWGVANGSRVLATSISRMDAVDMQGDYAYHTEIVPLYRSPPVTEPMPKEKRAEVSDRSKPINGPDPDSRVWETPVHTPATHATHGEGSEQRECTEPVAWAVRYRHGDTGIVDLCRTLADCRAKWRHRTTDYWLYEPLYRHPPCQDLSRKTLTLTDAEREALERTSIAYELLPTDGAQQVSATLRGLLGRLGGGE